MFDQTLHMSNIYEYEQISLVLQAHIAEDELTWPKCVNLSMTSVVPWPELF